RSPATGKRRSACAQPLSEPVGDTPATILSLCTRPVPSRRGRRGALAEFRIEVRIPLGGVHRTRHDLRHGVAVEVLMRPMMSRPIGEVSHTSHTRWAEVPGPNATGIIHHVVDILSGTGSDAQPVPTIGVRECPILAG